MLAFLFVHWVAVGRAEVPSVFEDAWIAQRARTQEYPASLPEWLRRPVPAPARLDGWNDAWAKLANDYAVPLRVGSYFAQIGAARAAAHEVDGVVRALGRINAAIRDVGDPARAAALLRFVLIDTAAAVRDELGPLDPAAQERVAAFTRAIVAAVDQGTLLARADRGYGSGARVDAFFDSVRGFLGAALVGTAFTHMFVHLTGAMDFLPGLVAGTLGIVFARTRFPPSARRSDARPVRPVFAEACAPRLLAGPAIED